MKFIRKCVPLLLAMLLSVQLSIPALAAGQTEAVSIENVDGVCLDEVSAELKLVPEPILARFADDGWTVRMDREYLERLSENYGYTCIAATSYRNRGIYLTAASSLVHEFGHFLHYALGFPQETEALFEAEARNAAFLRDHARSNFREYFADCFAYWIKNREDADAMTLFAREAPETFCYFAALEEDSWTVPADQ